jgi:hypothetical protein
LIFVLPQPHASALAVPRRDKFDASRFKRATYGGKVIRNWRATASLKTSNGGTTDICGISQLVLIPVQQSTPCPRLLSSSRPVPV